MAQVRGGRRPPAGGRAAFTGDAAEAAVRDARIRLRHALHVREGAPQARQVSDRWHLVKNLAACVSVLLAQSLGKLRRAEQAAANIPEEEQHSRQPHSHPRTRAEKLTQQARQAERMARYEQIMALQKQGLKSADIATQVGMPERSVREWLSRGDIPYSGPRQERAGRPVKVPGVREEGRPIFPVDENQLPPFPS